MLAAILTSSASRLFPNPKPTAFSLVRTLSSSSSRFQVRSMADSASSSPFKKIQIQRDDTEIRLDHLNERNFNASSRFPKSKAGNGFSILVKLMLHLSRLSETFDAYVVGKEDAPGIVVLQEWWGVDFEIKNHAVKISQLGPGFKALIPDLYRGKVGLDVAEAQHLMDGLDWQGAVKDICASANWLKANGSKKVGVTGFCMGGALSIASSVLAPEVDAVVAFYGVPSSELADPAQAKAPVQAHFGELDSFVGFSDVTAAKALEEKLKASGVPYEVHIYPGNAHAFMNRSPEGVTRRKGMGMPDEDEAAVELAWSRFQSWMTRYLSA